MLNYNFFFFNNFFGSQCSVFCLFTPCLWNIRLTVTAASEEAFEAAPTQVLGARTVGVRAKYCNVRSSAMFCIQILRIKR